MGPMPPVCIPIPPCPALTCQSPLASSYPSQGPSAASEVSCPPCLVLPCCCSWSCPAACHNPVAVRLPQCLHIQVLTLDPCLSSASPWILAFLAFPWSLACPLVLHIDLGLRDACTP